MSNNPTISAVDAKERFTELLNRVSHHKEHIVITRRGKDIAALIPIEDLHLMEECLNQSDLEEALASHQEVRAKGTITLAQLKMEIE